MIINLDFKDSKVFIQKVNEDRFIIAKELKDRPLMELKIILTKEELKAVVSSLGLVME